jgi:glycosyltransferase involved in cell wall biosynthesis
VRRVLVASTFLPPHVGGVEFFVDWMKRVMPSQGWEVVTAGCRGDGDLLWPCPTWQPANIPLALPSRKSVSRLTEIAETADAVLIQNFFYPFSNWAVVAGMRAQRPMRTIVHGNAIFPSGAGIVTRVASVAQSKSLGRWQLRHAPPIAISRSSADHVRRDFGMNASVLPLPVPDGLTPGHVDPPQDDGPFRVVFAGRLVELKDPLAALNTVKTLGEKRRVSFDVYGDGPLRPILEAAAPSWVRFHGTCSRDETIDAIRGAHCFISSSTTDNAQTALLESLCMGVPAVATDVGEASTYLNGDLRRLVVMGGDTGGLGRALETVAADWSHFRSEAISRGNVLREIHGSAAVAQALGSQLNDMVLGQRS